MKISLSFRSTRGEVTASEKCKSASNVGIRVGLVARVRLSAKSRFRSRASPSSANPQRNEFLFPEASLSPSSARQARCKRDRSAKNRPRASRGFALPIESPVSTSSPLSLPSSRSAISAHRCGRSHGNAHSHVRLTAVRFRDCDFGEPQLLHLGSIDCDAIAGSRF